MENEITKGSGFNGKYKSIPSELRKMLSQPMPKESIKPHPTKTYLSTIKAIFVIERLNTVFGIGGWEIEHHVVEKIPGEKPYIVMAGRIYMRDFDLYTSWQYGGHELSGKGTEPADGYKSAVTDIISKCASLLEIGIQVFKGEPNSQKSNEFPEKKEEPVSGEENFNLTPKKTPLSKEEKKVVKKVEPIKETVKEVEKPKEEPVAESSGVVERYKKIIQEYVDHAELRKKATDIIFDATLEGATEDEQNELKKFFNAHYSLLKNGKQ